MTEEKLPDIEEEKIKEAEIEQSVDLVNETDRKMETERNKKMDVYIEFALIFILGVLIGIAVKTEANKRITIGFDDYQMKLAKQDFNINKLQFEVTKKSAEDAKKQNPAGQQDSVEPVDGNVSGN